MNVSALNESGIAVDWWFIYKIPKLTASTNSDDSSGYEYVYFDATSSEVKKSPFELNQPGKGALNRTLDSVFSKPDRTTGYILYNDEKPAVAGGADDGNCGHTKGVIAFDTATKTAFWLLHSWPKYAAPNDKTMPAAMYGQTYLCISLDLATANQIAALMAQHQEPQCFLPRALTLTAGDPLHALTLPLAPPAAGLANVIECTSIGKMPFKVLAKNREWNDDFWNDFVGPALKEDLDTETWIRGPIPPVADSDGIHKTFDIKYINLGPLGAHYAWPETHDHAKWAITKDNDWICVGDINRMISQRKRGGGTIAFQNHVLWLALSKTDLLLAPPGHTRDEARELIKATHTDPDAPSPAKKSTRGAAKKPSASARVSKKRPAKKTTNTHKRS